MSREEPPNDETGAETLVADEERLLNVIQDAIGRAEGPQRTTNYDQDLLILRDAIAEEKLGDDKAALIEQMDRLAALSATRARHVEGRADPSNPYFAHMRIAFEDRPPRDICLGRHAFLSGGVRVVDWRNAPISRVFYRTRQGEPFDAWIAGREMHGDLEVRRTVTISNGDLCRIHAPEGVMVKTEGTWHSAGTDTRRLEGGAGKASRPDTQAPLLGHDSQQGSIRSDKHLPEIAALLDGEQFDLITRPDSGIVAIQGIAGSGKTTVGLHRLAYLNFQSPRRFRSNRMLVIVFSQALARYISHVLPALGVRGVSVQTLRQWSGTIARKHFKGLSRNHAPDTPGPVVRFKTHAALIPMLDEACARAHRSRDARELFDELFTDRHWIANGLARHAPGAFLPGEIRTIHRWCTDLHAARFDGDTEGNRFCGYDAEDEMILLRMHQCLRGGLQFSRTEALEYAHVFIDEAQDFSPLELLVLHDTARDHSLTIAGDTAQQIQNANTFSDWTEVLGALGGESLTISPLSISYRATGEIMEVAHAVLGSLAPAVLPESPRSGAPVELLQFGGAGEALTWLADALSDLVDREPRAGVAVLCRYANQADEAYAVLERCDLANMHRIREQDFSFAPGIEVTDVAQTKGLEFDYVVILHADAETWPETDTSRRLLHVALTRAAHQAWLISWNGTSPILPESLRTREMN